jgi:hypothetical protein
MKSSVRGLFDGCVGCGGSDSFASGRMARAGDRIGGNHSRPVVHSGDDSDATNLNFSFTNYGNGYGGCDYGEDDAIASGVEVALLGKSCGAYYYDCYYYDYCPPTSSFPFE